MKYVYILQSISFPDNYYTGVTDDLEKRLKKHNSGDVSHTSKYRPWKLKSFIAFDDEIKALEFEKYLKTGSGQAFAKKHL